MTLTMIFLFSAAVLLDTLGATLFKIGANRQESADQHLKIDNHLHIVWRSLKQWEIPLGVLVYILEYVLWISYIATTQLSRAFPMSSVTIVLILIVSKWILREEVSRKRWLGATLIIAGVLMLGVEG